MLKVYRLSKKYKNSNVMAVKDITFSIRKGEIVGLIGGNGAGKTTIMKMIAKSLQPTEGDIHINGQNIFRTHSALKDVNIMIEPVFYTHISAYENIKFYLKINKLNASNEQIKQVMKLVGLWKVKDKRANEFSFGMKQRLGLAMCLASEPAIVIMDEPFVGLDPNGVTTLISHLKKWAKSKGMAMLISSHQLGELEMICDRYLYIENGVLRKSFNAKDIDTTLLYVKESISPELITKYDETELLEDKIIKTRLIGEEMSQLIAEISLTNAIIKVEKDEYLKGIFKGEDSNENTVSTDF